MFSKSKLAIVLGVALSITGCSSIGSNDSSGYSTDNFYQEPSEVVVSGPFDDLFANGETFYQEDIEGSTNHIYSEGGFDPEKLEELKEKGVDLSALDNNLVSFPFDSYDLSDKSKENIEKHAELLKSVPELKVILEGHTDKRGDRAYNLKLGERRALAVKNFAESLGVPSDQMEVISYGEEKLVSHENTEAAHKENRRAVFVYN